MMISNVGDKESGFTLIELLVVILIIGILTAIAVPAYMNQRKKAITVALQSDIKSIATGVTGEGLDFTGYTSVLEGDYVSLIVGENGEHSLPSTEWKEHTELSPLYASPNSVIEVIMRSGVETTEWQAHEVHEFCLAGSAVNSTYDYHPGAGIHRLYDTYIFYDMALGGLATMDELVEEYQAGGHISCSSYADRYISAT